MIAGIALKHNCIVQYLCRFGGRRFHQVRYGVGHVAIRLKPWLKWLYYGMD